MFVDGVIQYLRLLRVYLEFKLLHIIKYILGTMHIFVNCMNPYLVLRYGFFNINVYFIGCVRNKTLNDLRRVYRK